MKKTKIIYHEISDLTRPELMGSVGLLAIGVLVLTMLFFYRKTHRQQQTAATPASISS